MTTTLQLASERLLLREWQPRDLTPFAAMNADPAVMRYFHAPMTQQETEEAMARYNAQLARDGFTMFAAEDRATGELLGILGAQTMRFAIPNVAQPAVEIGWRLATTAQGKGLATEGANAILNYLRETTQLHEVVAITAVENQPSRRVMEKLGMTYMPALDFDHPNIPADSHVNRTVVYRRAL
ncbi:Protein N-acetyltransferase, RimJ/RimL family [Bryocella elongata]|uniref:Protein N-acetyltransferase, RimJ/RimL family n=1 Tax=Bryocella elongata TaxID=863522 RepID=A0A1H5SW19_9BACT|nr:GNAT family N-acetyltransferase [Bryocella elongata]SEF54695.1 Protein N-acetyltransferase, RimJ/RimL family [Bryocella elongata]